MLLVHEKSILVAFFFFFFDPHCELICCNKLHPRTLGISTPPERALNINVLMLIYG